MTRSADDETLRVPAGCPKHPVHRSCLRRTPGRDSTLERRSPEVKAEARFDRIFASRSPLGERSARAFRLAIPWHDPATCGAAAMPRNHPRHADSHERFQTLRDSSSRLLRIRGPALSLRLAAACALSETRNRGSLGFHDANLSRRRGGSSQTASVFLNHPRAPPCFTAQPSRSPHRPWQVRSELGTASGSEGFSLFADRRAPDRLLPLGSRLRAEIVGSSPSTPWSPLRGSRYERYREPCASVREGRGPTVVQRPAKERSHRNVPEVPPAAPPSGEGCSP